MLGLIAAAVMPVLFYLLFVYKKDTIKEPIKVLLKCFLGGMLSVLFSLVFSSPLAAFSSYFITPESSAFYKAFFQAAIPEELAKFLILYWIIWRSRDFDQHFDGIVYAVFVSLGFAMVENVMYVINGGYSVAVVRAVLSVPGHGFFGVFMGFYLAMARFRSTFVRRSWNLLLAVLIPVLLHGVFDFLLFYSGYFAQNQALLFFVFGIFGVFVIVMWKLGLKRIKMLVNLDQQQY